ncbi:MAG: adenylate/guanylate cyclase [Leptospirales bacterium]|nr:adenylate/guanylate cyclase [Leptospirales bacterium]
MARLLISIAILLATFSAVNPEDRVLDLHDAAERVDMSTFLDILEDPQAALTIENVASAAYATTIVPEPGQKSIDLIRKLKSQNQKAFVQNNMRRPTFGFSSSAYWLRIKLKNIKSLGPTERQWLIEAGYPSLDYVHIYVPDEQGGYMKFESGDKYLFDSRQFNFRNPVFRIPHFTGEKQIYIRIQTSGTADMPLTLYSYSGFTSRAVNEQYGYGLYFGIMIAMVLYNLFIFVSTRDTGYIHYVGFIFCNTLFQMNLRGFAFQYLWPENIWWAHQSAGFFLGTFAAFGAQFTRHFLNTKEIAPVLDKVLLGLLVLEIAIAGASLLGFSHEFMSRAMVIGGGLFAILAAITGYRCFFKGYRPARYFNIAFTIYFAAGVLQVLVRASIVPFTFFTEQAEQMGFAIQVILLSLGLADRINIMKREKEIAQAEMLESRRVMLQSFSRFVPRQFLTLLGRESIVDVGLGDSVEKDFTVLFTDIRSFTSLSEKMTAEENFRFLNSFLKRMGPVIHKNNGFIDKFMGDAIMALFPESPKQALEAAIDMRRELDGYNLHRQREGREEINIGIGLHTGHLMLGTVGSEARLDTTVIGDTVNLASRLESLTKTFRISVLVSQAVYQRLPEGHNFKLREIDTVRVKGRSEPVIIYEAYDGDPEPLRQQKDDAFDDFVEGLRLYKQGDFHEAMRIFESLAAKFPDDAAHAMYVRRCQKLLAEPPGSGWRGVSRMVMK